MLPFGKSKAYTMNCRIVAVYSNHFLENSDQWCAVPSSRLLGDLHKAFDSARWIATVKGPSGTIRVAIGDPIPNSYKTNDLYIPHWLLSQAGVEGVGEEMQIRFERCEDMKKATQLKFTYLGELSNDIDMRELLETPLSQLGVVTKGQIIPAPVLEGNLVVSHVEPAGIPVFLDGNEVEFSIQGDKRPPTPVPEVLPEVLPEETSLSGLLPASMEQQAQPVQRYTSPTTSSRGRFANKSSFIPFSGQGRTLGS